MLVTGFLFYKGILPKELLGKYIPKNFQASKLDVVEVADEPGENTGELVPEPDTRDAVFKNIIMGEIIEKKIVAAGSKPGGIFMKK